MSNTGVPLYLSRCSGEVSGFFCVGALFVDNHDPPEVCGEVSFQTSTGAARGLAFGDLLVVVGAAQAAGHPDLDHRHRVDLGVQLPVPVAREAVPVGVGSRSGWPVGRLSRASMLSTGEISKVVDDKQATPL